MNGVLEIERGRQMVAAGTSTTSQAVNTLLSTWTTSGTRVTPMGDLAADMDAILSRASSGQMLRKSEGYQRLLETTVKEIRNRPAPDATWSQRIGREITDAAD